MTVRHLPLVFLLSVFLLNLSIRKRFIEDFFFLFFSEESVSMRSEGELFAMGFFVMYASSNGGGMSTTDVGVDKPLEDRGECWEKLPVENIALLDIGDPSASL